MLLIAMEIAIALWGAAVFSSLFVVDAFRLFRWFRRVALPRVDPDVL